MAPLLQPLGRHSEAVGAGLWGSLRPHRQTGLSAQYLLPSDRCPWRPTLHRGRNGGSENLSLRATYLVSGKDGTKTQPSQLSSSCFFYLIVPPSKSRPLPELFLPHRSPGHRSAVRHARPRLFRQALPGSRRKGPGLVQSKSNQKVLNVTLATVTIVIH